MYFKKMRLVVLLAIVIVLSSGARAADNTPGQPGNLAYTTDIEHFWINYTWSAGANTDSFNTSVNGMWTNGTADRFINTKSSPHGWANISVAGYNSTLQQLSDFEYKTARVPDNPITLTNVSFSYLLYEGQALYIDADYTDADGDVGIFTTNATKGTFNSSRGVLSWKTGGGDRGVYNWQINVSDGHGSISLRRFTVIVNPIIPGRPTYLTYTTGNPWVNYTWLPINYADSYNISINGNWDNGSTVLFKNITGSSPHEWVNISVAGYYSSSQTLSDFVSLSTQIPDNPITLINVSDRYSLNENDILYISPNYIDSDGDAGVFDTNATCVTNAKCTFNPSTGALSWTTGTEDDGTYNWYINVTDRYGSISTQEFKVIVPFNLSIKFIEPAIVDDKKQWIDARIGHIGKSIAASVTFKNTGEDSLNLAVTEIHNNTRTKIPPSTVAKDGSFSYRKEFEINSTEINGGLFNYTFEIEAIGSNGRESTFRYSNTTTISLPIIPIYKIKRADADAVVVSQDRSTPPIIYTLEANSSINLTNVSIYDPFYPGKYFNISRLEANKPSSISYTYQATTNDLSSKKCDEQSPCIINMATFTGKVESSGELITDTDYVEILVYSAGSTKGSSSGGGGGGGGGIPPSEDYNNIEKRETWEMDILAKSASVYTFKTVDPVMVVSFESSTSENEVAVAVEILKNRSKRVGADAPGKLYKYFNIYVGTSGFGKKVSKGVVAYRVNNSWLEENGLNPEDISLYKWEGSWVKKDTEIVERRSNQTYYASLVGNFSNFAIAGKKPEVVSRPMNYTSNESNTTQTSAGSDSSGLSVDLNLVIWIIAIVGIISVFYYLKAVKRPPRSREEPPDDDHPP